MSNLLVVTGATGSQGSGVIKYFQEHKPSWKLRGLTRNPSSAAARECAKSGVEIVQADYNDVDSLKVAFVGATAIFAYTDVLGLLTSPQIMGRVMNCLLYTSPSPRDGLLSRMPSSA